MSAPSVATGVIPLSAALAAYGQFCAGTQTAGSDTLSMVAEVALTTPTVLGTVAISAVPSDLPFLNDEVSRALFSAFAPPLDRVILAPLTLPPNPPRPSAPPLIVPRFLVLPPTLAFRSPPKPVAMADSLTFFLPFLSVTVPALS